VKGIPGTGIGLTLAKEIVEAHGGRIFVESVPNKGSVFTVRLPLSGEASPVSG
jgi:signal transduction histidine kinase